jgi:hypothetical protein
MISYRGVRGDVTKATAIYGDSRPVAQLGFLGRARRRRRLDPTLFLAWGMILDCLGLSRTS